MYALQSVNKHLQPITARVSRRLAGKNWNMFYFLPATGAGKTGAGTGKNRLPEDTTHAPVSGSR